MNIRTLPTLASRSRVIAIALATVASLGVGAAARSNAESYAAKAKQAIQTVYNQADDAATAKSAQAAAAHYGDPGLQKSTEAGLQSLYAISTTQQFASKIVSIEIPPGNRNSAIVIVQQHFQGLIKQPRTGKLVLAASDARIREFWVQSNRGWIAMRSHLLSMKRTVNSKPVKSW